MKRGAIVLCGGRSCRMGQSKAALPFGPEAMLQRVVRLVEGVVDQVAIVAAPGQDLPVLPDGVLVVHDRREGRGPLEGLAAGLAALAETTDAVYATGCDVPLLVPAFAERLFDLLEDHDIVVPTDGEFFHPLAAVYRTRVLDAVDRLLTADRLRPVFLFDQVDTLRLPVDRLRDVDRQLDTLANVNRPADYADALRRAGFPGAPGVVE